MDIKEFSTEIKSKMQSIGIEINEKQVNKFYIYMNMLKEWNERMNLTAITEPKDIILKHFFDSATIEKYIGVKVLDIGTGAGFPGIPLKILREDINIVLADSLNKRINFLREVIKELDLKNIEVIHARAEELGKNKKYREKFDTVVSRAVAPINVLSEYTIPLCEIGGKCIFMKGANIDEEIKDGIKAIQILGGKIDKIDELFLEKDDNNRKIIIVEKMNNTPTKYPRKPGTPSKEPIK